jgi:hypothetical protein
MTLILMVVGMAALFYFIQRKSWFIAFGLIVLISSAAIITSIIQIQIMSALAFCMLFGVMWLRHATHRSATRTKSCFTAFFRSDKNADIEIEQIDDSASEKDQQENEWQARTNKKKYLLYIALFIIFASLFVPIALYAKEFGIEGWQQYQHWITMGSTLAGVYSMIIALLVFLFLVSQLMLRFKKNSSEYDHVFIKDSKHDVEFYLTELDNYLNQWADDTHTLRELLHARCGVLSEKKLASKRIQEQLAEFAHCHPKLLDIWRPLVKILDKLALPARYPYQHNNQSCVQKTSSILSFQTCVALDKLDFVLSAEDAVVLSSGASSSGSSDTRYFWHQEKQR